MEITSLTNAKVKLWVKYKEKKQRDKDQCFLIEGEHLIEEAHHAGIIEYLIVRNDIVNPYNTYDTYEVTQEILHKISTNTSHVQMMAVCRYSNIEPSVCNRILMLDDVQDPGNLGTMIRTALSFGYDQMILSSKCVDIYNEKVIRSTQGALFHMPIVRCELADKIKDLKEKGYEIFGTSLHDAKPLSDIQAKPNHVLIMGNEGQGVHDEILALCDQNIYIEMHTFESLNVAVAAGICMYKLGQQ